MDDHLAVFLGNGDHTNTNSPTDPPSAPPKPPKPPPPPHVFLGHVAAALRCTDAALARGIALPPLDPVRLQALHAYTERPDETPTNATNTDPTIFVRRTEAINTATLVGLLRLRIDLARHEPTWRRPGTGRYARFLLDDAHVASDDVRFEPVRVDRAPVLFWSMRRIVALFSLLVEHRRTLDTERTVRPLVVWGARRAAMLLTYTTLDAVSHDVPQYRTLVGRPRVPVAAAAGPPPTKRARVDPPSALPRYHASPAAVWDIVALLRPLWRLLAHRHDDVQPYPFPTLDPSQWIRPFTQHVVQHMQGDTLPLQYQAVVVHDHVRPHHPAWFQRRRPHAHAPRPMDMVQECAGTAFASQVHGLATRRLRDVVAADPCERWLVQACVAYYAQQKRLLDPTTHIAWVPGRNTWAVRHPDTGVRTAAPTYNAAVVYCCHTHWPETTPFLTAAAAAAAVPSSSSSSSPPPRLPSRPRIVLDPSQTRPSAPPPTHTPP